MTDNLKKKTSEAKVSEVFYNGDMNKKILPFLVPALLALLVALWAGLLRLGWVLPSTRGLALAHGPLMVSGFLGALIALERAVALKIRWM